MKSRCSSSNLLTIKSVLGATLIVTLSGPASSSGQECTSQEVEVGYKNFNFSSEDVTVKPTASKPESKLWYHDDSWWGILWDPVSQLYTIYRMDKNNQCWSNVGPGIDERPRSSADVLSDGNTLYISSRARTSHKDVHGPQTARLYRLTYHATTKLYTLDTGFPVEINNTRSETLVLTKDSTGQLWVTWTAGGKVMINRSLSDNKTWGVPFHLSVQGNDVDAEDISSIVHLGNRIGIMWSNEIDQKMYFATHLDGSIDTLWEPREVALEDAALGAVADNHINLAVSNLGSETKFVAVVKTALVEQNAPLIFLLKRRSNGVWSRHVVGFVRDRHTRPIVLLDSETDSVYVVARVNNNIPDFFLKSAHYNNPQFEDGKGKRILFSALDENISNATSTKQSIDSGTDLVFLAADNSTLHYFHNTIDIASNSFPTAVDDTASTKRNTPVVIDALSNDSDVDGSLDGSSIRLISLPDNGTIAVNNLSGLITYSPFAGFIGTDDFIYTVEDNLGAPSNQATVHITVFQEDVPGVFRFGPMDDAQVKASRPTKNYGIKDAASVESEDYLAFFKFQVAGLVENVQSARLRLYVTNESEDGGTVTLVSNDFGNENRSWNEEELNWNNAPLITGAGLDAVGEIVLDTFVEFDVTSAISGNSIYSFGIANTSDDRAQYNTKEGANPPELIVVTGDATANVPPQAVDDADTTSAETAVTIDVLANDSDADDGIDAATVTIAEAPSNGTAVVDESGSIVYTPNSGFTGSDTLRYSVRDQTGATSNIAWVAILVEDSGGGSGTFTFETIEDAQVKLSDPNANYGDKTSAKAEEGTFHAYFKFDVAGLIGSITGAKVRFVVVNSSDNGGSIHSVSNDLRDSSDPWKEDELTAANAPLINGPPLNSLAAVSEGSFVEFDVLGAIFGDAHYSFGIENGSKDKVAYGTKEGEHPPLLIIETDARGNAEPLAQNDAASTFSGEPVTIDILANDSDSDGVLDVTSVSLQTLPANGSTTVNPTGDVTYTPNAGFAGTDFFSYRVRDDDGAFSREATVTLTISSQNDILTFEPIEDAQVKLSEPNSHYGDKSSAKAEAGKFHAYFKFNVEGLTGGITSAKIRFVVVNSSDDGGSIHSVSNDFLDASDAWNEDELTAANAPPISGPSLSTLAAVSEGSFVEFDVQGAISADAHYSFGIENGSDDKVAYGTKEGEHPPLLIIETGAQGNAAPVVQNDLASTLSGEPVTIDILANDSDSDGVIDVSSVALQTLPSNGSAIVNQTGDVTYTPNAEFVGTDLFSYRVSDDGGAVSAVATVTVTISSQRDILTFQPVHDAQVKASRPDRNYGANTSFKVEEDVFTSFLKFEVSGIVGNISSALLRLYVTNRSDTGGSVHLVSNNFLSTTTPWTEAELTQKKAPSISGPVLDTAGKIREGTFIEFDVLSAIHGDGTYSFALKSSSTDKAEYESKEAPNAPQLVLEQVSSGGNALAKSGGAGHLQRAKRSAANSQMLPSNIALRPNFPNPFNPETVIRYDLPDESQVSLAIFNVRGQEVRRLVDRVQQPGFKQISWNGMDNFGRIVSSGVYFLRLNVDGIVQTRKITVQK